LYFVKDQDIKAYKGVKRYLHAFIISVLDTDELWLSHLPTIMWEEEPPMPIEKKAG
jgi:hypothetical protein